MAEFSEFRRERAWRIVLAAAVGCASGLTALLLALGPCPAARAAAPVRA